jgi:hypothetical protein
VAAARQKRLHIGSVQYWREVEILRPLKPQQQRVEVRNGQPARPVNHHVVVSITLAESGETIKRGLFILGHNPGAPFSLAVAT